MLDIIILRYIFKHCEPNTIVCILIEILRLQYLHYESEIANGCSLEKLEFILISLVGHEFDEICPLPICDLYCSDTRYAQANIFHVPLIRLDLLIRSQSIEQCLLNMGLCFLLKAKPRWLIRDGFPLIVLKILDWKIRNLHLCPEGQHFWK